MATSWPLLAGTRVLVGIGVGAALVVSAVIVAEAWEARTRAVMLGILSVAYPVGIIGSGLVTATVPNWRVAFLAGALCALLAWPVRAFVRDSARWVAESTHSREGVWSSHRGALWSGMLVYGTMLLGLWAAFSWLPTWVQSLLAADGTSGQAERGSSMALLGVGGLVGGVASGWLANAFGLKRVQAICFVLCLVLSYLLFEASTVYGVPVMAGIALLGVAFGVSQGVLNTYVPELFPAAVRSAATALCFHVGRIFTAVAVFFVGSLVVWFGGYGHAIFAFSLTYVVGLVALYRTRRGAATVDALEPVG
jgi:MFS family permease